MSAADPGFGGPELCRLSARRAVALLKSGEITPADLVEASLTRIAQCADAVNATVTPCPDRARAAAAQSAPDTLLAGLPVGIKDLTEVAGLRTTWGNTALADTISDVSDPMVTRLESCGAIVIGKTNTPEMGAGANTFNAVFGPTRNPWDTRMNAGGSSGGAAAGLATGEAWLSLGSDLGGSLRTPASFCGVVGLRPSPGVCGSGTATDAFDAMPVTGPMARDVADCALFLDAMSGLDPAAPLSRPAPPTRYLDTCLQAPGPVAIAFAPDLGGIAPVTLDMHTTLSRAMDRLQAAGVEVTEAAPETGGAVSCFRTLRALGMWAQARQTPEHVRATYKPALQQNIREGAQLGVDMIADAMATRTRLFHAMRGFLDRHEVLACPVTGISPLLVEFEYPPEIAGVPSRDYLDWLSFAFPATLCGLPALSLPVGLSEDGLPVGVQLIGRPRGEARLLQVARHFEEILGASPVPIDPVIRHG
ncbi:amidase [Pseudoponticoccus marisrubri]|uniref:Amidase n=1 Tax=Pseudoponticoccus marisrubri TaxID=1685382 RepID=A0A0W7WGQ6_9RHOB|nr:amidase family protein [Pseudoponticoccus marisrubri]KUF09655.1 amidase [Pseudoponticoccus marisrubri]